jgi:hypothetical protein
MNSEETLDLARKRIAFLEGQVADADARYDKMAREAYTYRNETKRLDYAIRDHRYTVLHNPGKHDIIANANEILWSKLND